MAINHKAIVQDTTSAIVEIFAMGREFLSEENALRIAKATQEVLESPAVETYIAKVEESPLYEAIGRHVDNMVMAQLASMSGKNNNG